MPHSPRTDAFWRFVAAFTYLPLAVLGLASLLLLVAFVWWPIDLVMQFLFDNEGLSGSEGTGGLVVQFWDHIVGNIEWVILGRGKFQWMP